MFSILGETLFDQPPCKEDVIRKVRDKAVDTGDEKMWLIPSRSKQLV